MDQFQSYSTGKVAIQKMMQQSIDCLSNFYPTGDETKRRSRQSGCHSSIPLLLFVRQQTIVLPLSSCTDTLPVLFWLRCYAPCVERLRLDESEQKVTTVVDPQHIAWFWRKALQTFLFVTHLDLQDLSINRVNIALSAFGERTALATQIRCVTLPTFLILQQHLLSPFVNLEELHISGCNDVHCISFEFCASTLRRLNARFTTLNDQSLAPLGRLEVLDCTYCKQITTLEPFAESLRVLRARGATGLKDAALSSVFGLDELDVTDVTEVTTVAPFASSLRHLTAGGGSGISDASIAMADILVILDVKENEKVTAIPDCFARSLRELSASGSGITDRLMSPLAAGIVKVDLSGDGYLTSLEPFALSLRELDANDHSCHITDSALCQATNLVTLRIQNNPHIETLTSCATTLLELDCRGRLSKINDAALASVTGLQYLDASTNIRVTTIAPFVKSLKALSAGWKCGIDQEGLCLDVEGNCLSKLYIRQNDNNIVVNPQQFAGIFVVQ